MRMTTKITPLNLLLQKMMVLCIYNDLRTKQKFRPNENRHFRNLKNKSTGK